MSLKKEVIDILDNIADILEFKGDNPFKINAFRNGANVLRNTESELEELIKTGELKNLKGIGSSIQSVISDYAENGYSTLNNSLVNEIPAGILDFLKIRGLGKNKIKVLYNELGIKSLQELETACKENKIAGVKGFGDKTQSAILDEIRRVNSNRDKVLIHIAEAEVNRVLGKLTNINSIKQIEISGDYRRSLEIISELQFVLLISDLNKFETEIPATIITKEKQKIGNVEFLKYEIESMLTIPVYLLCTYKQEEFTGLLLYSTGSKEFLKKGNLEKIVPSKDEAEIF